MGYVYIRDDDVRRFRYKEFRSAVLRKLKEESVLRKTEWLVVLGVFEGVGGWG